MLSLNVRGIGDGTKRREIFRWLKRYHKGNNSIVLLQETHSTLNSEEKWVQEWGSKIYFSHGTNNARGVAILMPMEYNFDINELWKDIDGRIIALTLKVDERMYNVVNVYAPTKDKVTEQLEFLKTLDTNLELAETPFIIGGHFNTYLDPILDKEGGKIEGQSKFSDNLIYLLNEYNIIDVWRVLNPSRKCFTWRQRNPLIQSRLDYFLISGELFYNVSETQIKPSIKTDHSLLQIQLNILEEQKRGPGFWKFNSALLRDEVYIDATRALIENLKEQYSDIQNHGLKWDLIKSEIRQSTINYCKTQARIRREAENELKIQYLEAATCFEKNSNNENLEALENIKEQIEAINAFKTAGAHIRSKAEHIEENERSTSYFLNVEKRNYKMKHIKKLNISETEMIEK
jgi:exodeoxyribonuclease-3